MSHDSVFGRRSNVLHRSIAELRDRMRRLNPIGFTHDEFLALFAPPEHWPILRSAAEVARVSGDVRVMNANVSGFAHDADLVFSLRENDDGPMLLMPRNSVVLAQAPAALRLRLADWIDAEVEMGFKFARAKALLAWLEYNCENRAAVRFLWPSVVALCSLHEYTEDLGRSLSDFKPVRTLPHLPQEVRAACRDTAGLIASAMLLEAEAPPAEVPPVSVSLISPGTMSRDGGALGQIRFA